MSGDNGAPVREQVRQLREKLLDLTLRNPMLNFRPSRRSGVVLEGELFDHVWRRLIEDGRTLRFQGKPDPGNRNLPTRNPSEELHDYGDPVSLLFLEEAAEAELDASMTNPALPRNQLDDVLQAADTRRALENKLTHIRRLARTSEEELGINTLFLAMGALDWVDQDGRACRAPLVFVPVDLEVDRFGRTGMKYDGGDVGANRPLQAKLAEFGLTLPDLAERETMDGYFEEVQAIVRSRGWAVDPNFLYLGFFNFERFVMYEDLRGAGWPEGRKPENHELAIALLRDGFPPAQSKLTDESHLDAVRPPRDSYEVFDADACQLLVLERVKEGHSILVEGPPGTGKSQTIANLIAEAVARDKTVLFVAAKRAAVDVVARRLKEKGLERMCLDLHAKTASRRGFFEELSATMVEHVKATSQQPLVDRLQEIRQELNKLSAAVNEPVEPFGVSPFVAMGRLAALPPADPEDLRAGIQFADLASFEAHRIQQLVPLVESLQELLPESGPACDAPFYRCALEGITPMLRLQIEEAVNDACNKLTAARRACEEAARLLQVPQPSVPREVGNLEKCANVAAEAPPHEGVDLTLDHWRTAEPSIRAAIALLRELRLVEGAVGTVFENGVLEEDWRPWAQPLVLRRDSLFRWFYRDYRDAARSYRSKLASPVRHSAAELADRTRAVLRGQELRRHVRELEATIRPFFGVQWQGCRTDPDNLELLLDWVLRVRSEVEGSALPRGLLAFLTGGRLQEGLNAVQRAQKAAVAARAACEQACSLLQFSGLAWAESAWTSLENQFQTWRDHLGELDDEIRRNLARARVRDVGLKILRAADNWPRARRRLVTALLRTYYEGVLEEARKRRPELLRFERTSHEKAIEEFRRLDDLKLQYNAQVVRELHSKRVPRHMVAGSPLWKIRAEAQKKTRHMSIRKAMSIAGPDIQRIKPVFLMSPLTVAIHLPPELPPFDLVVFDEASQIRPEEALCSIIRGRQLVVVGDTRQMPPTSFFDRVWSDADVEDSEDEEVQTAQQVRGLESVLDLMSARAADAARRPDLRWHYRSVHPTLIEPSNRHIYGSRLVVFPSPSADCDGHRVGIVFHKVQGVYQGGRNQRVNRIEAEAVLQAVWDHLHRCPELSLLVVAMNIPQSNHLDNELQRMRMREAVQREKLKRETGLDQPPTVFERYDKLHPNEPLTVKNLENVQGDERDVVMISVTYGPDESGRVAQRFGPILQDGGERRLNVLFSRARVRCEVFSSLTSADIQVPPESERKGLLFFREYLAYAETGRFLAEQRVGGEGDSPLEEEIAHFLRGRGFQADLHVGEGSCRIDVAVRDPKNPGRYMLGVQCDGPAYHSARTARDRDKLRRRVLEARGWRLHQVWSKDWYANRPAEELRLLEALASVEEASRVESEPAAPTPAPAADPQPIHPEPELPPMETVRVTEEAPLQLPKYKRSVASTVEGIVRDEAPICRELLEIRLCRAMGYQRRGRYVEQAIRMQIDHALRSGKIVPVKDAFFPADLQQMRSARDWSDLPPEEKRAEFVTLAELAVALLNLLQRVRSVDESAVAKELFRLIGFGRTSRLAQDRVQTTVQELLKAGRIVSENGVLRLP